MLLSVGFFVLPWFSLDNRLVILTWKLCSGYWKTWHRKQKMCEVDQRVGKIDVLVQTSPRCFSCSVLISHTSDTVFQAFQQLLSFMLPRLHVSLLVFNFFLFHQSEIRIRHCIFIFTFLQRSSYEKYQKFLFFRHSHGGNKWFWHVARLRLSDIWQHTQGRLIFFEGRCC